MRVAKVIEHHTLDQIDDLLKEYRTDAEVHDRLLFIRGVKCGIIVYYQIKFHKNSSTQFSINDSLPTFL